MFSATHTCWQQGYNRKHVFQRIYHCYKWYNRHGQRIIVPWLKHHFILQNNERENFQTCFNTCKHYHEEEKWHLQQNPNRRNFVQHMQHIPNNSNGKCNGKSTNENLVWSGNANSKGSWTVGERTSTSIRVEPGIGTGADSNRKIQVSISLTSCKTIDDVWSVGWPVNTVQTLSLKIKLAIGFMWNYNTIVYTGRCVYDTQNQ